MSQPRILIADDEPINRVLLQQLLEDEDYELLEAKDGLEALEIATTSPLDLILLDVMMPNLDGFEVCRRLKSDQKLAHVPILMVTSLADRSSRLQGMEAGANDFLTKPIDLSDTMLRVRNALRLKQLSDQALRDYERLRDLEQLRDSLFHMIVHDLKTPLTSVFGHLRLLQQAAAPQLDAKQSGWLQKSLTNCRRLQDMIASVLDVSKVEAGELKLHLTEQDLLATLREAAVSVESDSTAIAPEMPAEPLPLRCDHELVRRVTVNLLDNAAKYSPKGVPVRLRVEVSPEAVEVQVIDSGPGIAPELQSAIFEKFKQIDGAPRYSTGLGLTFCRLAVEAHGGAIGIRSVVGEGSTFWFKLPR